MADIGVFQYSVYLKSHCSSQTKERHFVSMNKKKVYICNWNGMATDWKRRQGLISLVLLIECVAIKTLLNYIYSSFIAHRTNILVIAMLSQFSEILPHGRPTFYIIFIITEFQNPELMRTVLLPAHKFAWSPCFRTVHNYEKRKVASHNIRSMFITVMSCWTLPTVCGLEWIYMTFQKLDLLPEVGDHVHLTGSICFYFLPSDDWNGSGTRTLTQGCS